MSHTTRCPACGTIFRIVAEQLRLSDGWVRCGHCADVFDATLYLAPWPPALAPGSAPGSAPGADPAAPSSDAVTAAGSTPPGPAGEADAGGAWAPPAPAARVRGAKDDFSSDLARFATDRTPQATAAGAPAETPPTTRPSRSKGAAGERRSSRRPQRPAGAVSARRTPPGEPPAAWPDTTDESVSPPEVGADLPAETGAERTASSARPARADEPAFLRQARRRAFWHSPAVRGALSLLALALLALLVAQWAVHDRDRLAARHPALAPVLLQLCAPLGCHLAPPRHIEAVVIDSTALVRRLANFYAFDVVLKNTAPMAVAMPALELSLTDAQDRVIARRVFLPSDLPGSPQQLAPQSSLALNLRLSVADATADALPMAGYRALVFYP